MRERIRELARDVRAALGAEDDIDAQGGLQRGKALRKEVSRASHGVWEGFADRPDPVALLKEQEQGRVEELLPLRHARMAQSPFAYYRGSALVMASDLARTPRTGIAAQICGDAHISNFGIFLSPERRLVFDINDFDETAPGPWEWDVKRLVASVEICGLDCGFSEADRQAAVRAAARSYREAMQDFAGRGGLDVWYAHLDVDALAELAGHMDKGRKKSMKKAAEKARSKNSARAVQKLTEVVDGERRIVSNPPLVVPLRDMVEERTGLNGQWISAETMERITARILSGYRQSLPAAMQSLVKQYRGVDMARKVVGVGSVGTRAWIVVLQGASENDHLVLQIKEAQRSVVERFAGTPARSHGGQRVVEGQKAMQAAGDPFLGWIPSVPLDGELRDFYVRQLWDGKGSPDFTKIDANGLVEFSGVCGWALAHAHARTGNRFMIAGYLGKSDVFDEAMAAFARSYAAQNQRDYERFLGALSSGELQGAAPAQEG